MAPLLGNPALVRALVIGIFGGVGLSVTVVFSRRGPMIFVPYAVILALLTWLLSRFGDVSFGTRFTAAYAGFVVATAMCYVTVCVHAERSRKELKRQGRLPDTRHTVGLLGHTWRLGFLFTIGCIVSAAVAFVAV